ncbi:toxic anion resistance protein [Porphyrobacter sp. YT40]|uniref:toxic anion resistance protein n=1 Tax=Porphyrobacter sp. YT40 TaxID=2547601 RepID=UPI0015E87B89|nr:toxic anion resistance protein [Porphyrobacter sp. YT40]
MPVPAISKRRHAELAGQALKYVAELAQIEPLSPAFDHKLEAIQTLGSDAIAALGARHAGSLAHVAPPPTEGIAAAIAALRRMAESLEPLRQGNLVEGGKRFGLFAARPDPAAYFRRYRAAQGDIEDALARLTRERDGLLRANVALEVERASLATPLTALSEQALFAEEVALTLEARADAMATREPLHAQRLRSDALHAVRSRQRDIAEARALAQQAVAVREVVSDSNRRLVAGIEQATETMVLVLRTAIAAARLIARQELVLDEIASLNRAASNLIASDAPVCAEADAAALQEAFVRLSHALDQLDQERAAITTLSPRGKPV